MGILGITHIMCCDHVKLNVFEWLCITEGMPPRFRFIGMPRAGTMVLSKNTVQVACERCHLDQIDLPYQIDLPTVVN